jgi:hypothetical protein
MALQCDVLAYAEDLLDTVRIDSITPRSDCQIEAAIDHCFHSRRAAAPDDPAYRVGAGRRLGDFGSVTIFIPGPATIGICRRAI